MEMIMIYFTCLVITLGMTTINIDESYKNNYYQITDYEYNIIQTVEQGTVFWKPYNIDAEKYITAELIFEQPNNGEVNLLFTCTQNNITTLLTSVNGPLINATYTDFNDYLLGKSYHMITIPPYTFTSKDVFYFTMIALKIKPPYRYTFSLRRTYDYQCYNNCTAALYGNCLQQEKVCQCDTGRLDLDCSAKGTPLMLGQVLQNQRITGTKYYYFEMTQQVSKIILDISTTAYLNTVQGYFMFENFKIGLPSAGYNDFKFTITQDQPSKQYLIDLKSLKYNDSLFRFTRLIISLVATQDAILSIGVYEPQSSDTGTTNLMLVYFLVGLALVLLLTWIIITFIRYKQARNARVADENRIQQIRVPRHQKKEMNEQIIQQYMPSRTYKQILDNLNFRQENVSPNEQCSVCLLEYEKTSICRITPCLHIFHADCLSEWVKKHENCPLCREDLTVHALQDKQVNEGARMKRPVS